MSLSHEICNTSHTNTLSMLEQTREFNHLARAEPMEQSFQIAQMVKNECQLPQAPSLYDIFKLEGA